MRQTMIWLLSSLAYSGCMTTTLQNLEVAAIGGQTLYRHEDFSAMQLYLSLAGGLFKTIGKNARLVIGGRITNFEDEGESDDLVVPDAFVQLDFILH